MTLFEVAGVSRASDPETSREAARAVSAGVEEAVLRVHRMWRKRWHDGLTDDELCACLPPEWHPPTIKSARSRLSRSGLLVDSGKRRPSDRGRDQIVWVVA